MGLSVVPAPSDLRRARRERNLPEKRVKLGARIAEIGADVSGGSLAPLGAVVILLDIDGCPEVDMSASVSWREIDNAIRAVASVVSDALYRPKKVEDFNTNLRREWERSRDLEAANARERASREAELKWRCDHCPSRFKTERGATIHERTCWKNPDSRRFASRELLPVMKDGKVIGCEGNPRYRPLQPAS